ncbi:MAG: hypothetical protein Q4Q32_05395 [Methanobrevibacter sp.]|nr:hypothetical protein [Methanobrevibacter sp.]
MKKRHIFVLFLILIIAAGGAFIIFAHGDGELIGQNELGSVERVDFTHSSNPQVKIGLVSGMHSREKLHQFAIPIVCWAFALNHDAEIINYQVNVTKDPEDFYSGRANGESLVHDYVVSDVEKSDLDLVIIGHDHEDGYGEGYYIATPTMDDPSVELARVVTTEIGFSHYTRNKSAPTQSSSILKVDNPIVDTGSRVFVYEIPENDRRLSSLSHTYQLLESSYNHLIGNN